MIIEPMSPDIWKQWLRQEQTFSMHRLVQTVLIDTMPPDLQKHWRAQVVQALNEVFPRKAVSDNGNQYQRLLPHALVCVTWKENEFTPTVGVAELLQNAGSSSFLSDYALEELLLTRSLSIYEQLLGVEHSTVAYALRRLAHLYYWHGNYVQAEPLLVRALSIKENHFGTNHSAITINLRDLAVLYKAQGKYGQAELLYLRAIKGFEILRVADVLPFTGAVVEFAEFLCEQGKHEQAEALVQHAISIVEHRLEATHPRSHGSKRLTVDYFHRILHRIGSNTEYATLDVNNPPSI